MKTVLNLIVSLMLMLFISGCSEDTTNEDTNNTTADQEQVSDSSVDDNSDPTDLLDDVVDGDVVDGRVTTNDGDTVTDTFNVGLETYAQYIYNKTGDFNVSVESSGSVVTESFVSMTKTTDTNYLNEFLPYTLIDDDSIDVQAFENIIWSSDQTKLLHFTIDNFSKDNPTTGTYSSDFLYYKSGGVELTHFTSYDVEVTSVEKDGNITHLIGSINNLLVSTQYDGDYTISVDFDMNASVYNRVSK